MHLKYIDPFNVSLLFRNSCILAERFTLERVNFSRMLNRFAFKLKFIYSMIINWTLVKKLLILRNNWWHMQVNLRPEIPGLESEQVHDIDVKQ